MSVSSVTMKCLLATLTMAVTLSLLACGSGQKPTTPIEEGIAFPDANLEVAVRQAIGKPTGQIQPSDLEALDILPAANSAISDLTGLEKCRNLNRLILSDNIVDDISPLASLTNLTELRLDGNVLLADISPLAGLSSLTILFLNNNMITDISPLPSLTGLT